MNIQEILGGQTASQLGPVEIKQVYESKQAGQTRKRGLLVEDSSGKTIVNIMGQAADGNFAAGESITLQAMGERGKIEANEYPQGSGKVTITAWSCQVVKNTGAGSQRQQSNQSNAGESEPAASGRSGSLSEDELIRKICETTDKMGRELNNWPNIPDAVKDHLMCNAADLCAKWFQGGKWPGCGH